MDFKIITGANDLYIKTLIDFIVSFDLNISYSKLIVYDLGLNKDNLNEILKLKEDKKFSLRKLNYNDYPEHVNTNKYYGLNCSYAFKSIAIYNEALNIENKDKILLWMDSANRFNNNEIIKIIEIIKKQGIYSPISSPASSLEAIELNYPEVVKSYGLTKEEHFTRLQSISANVIGFNYEHHAGYTILNRWYQDSLNKNLIIPEGSNRNNHRQDQTLLSLIVFLYEKENNIKFDYTNFNIQYWVKKDESTIEKSYQPYILLQKENNIRLATIYCRDIDEAKSTYAKRKQISIPDLLEKYNVINI